MQRVGYLCWALGVREIILVQFIDSEKRRGPRFPTRPSFYLTDEEIAGRLNRQSEFKSQELFSLPYFFHLRNGDNNRTGFLSRETGISGNFVGRIKGAKCPFDLQFLTWDFS